MPYTTDKFLVHKPSSGVDNNWHVTNENDTAVAHCYGFGHDTPSGEALARRIAACLNECRGISIQELDARQSDELLDHDLHFTIKNRRKIHIMAPFMAPFTRA